MNQPKNSQAASPSHVPILVSECLEFFGDSEIKVFVDGTLGAGGHARAILTAHPEIECYIGLDRDPQALGIAQGNLKEFENRMVFRQSNFADLDTVVEELGYKKVDGFFLTWECHPCN